MALARIKPVCNQVELHPFLPQRKLVGTCYRKVGCTGNSTEGCVLSCLYCRLAREERATSAASQGARASTLLFLAAHDCVCVSLHACVCAVLCTLCAARVGGLRRGLLDLQLALHALGAV